MNEFLAFAVILLGVIFLFISVSPKDLTIKQRLSSLFVWGYLLLISGFFCLTVINIYNFHSQITRQIIITFSGSFIEFVKAFAPYVWPIVISIIALSFKTDILSLLPRIRKVGTSGIELDPVNQQVSEDTKDSSAVKKILGFDKTPAMLSVEQRIEGELRPINESEKLAWAVGTLAATRLQLHFERIYQGIFGSQILLLKQLNNGYEMDMDKLKTFYSTYEKQYPEIYNRYSFEGWFSYLKNQELIEQIEDKVKISPVGIDLLLYLSARGLSLEKSG